MKAVIPLCIDNDFLEKLNSYLYLSKYEGSRSQYICESVKDKMNCDLGNNTRFVLVQPELDKMPFRLSD